MDRRVLDLHQNLLVASDSHQLEVVQTEEMVEEPQRDAGKGTSVCVSN